MNTNIKQISKNPTAYHNYNIEEKLEAGIVLTRNRNKINKTRKSKFKKRRSFYNWNAHQPL
mgnify:CR=1 FL=1